MKEAAEYAGQQISEQQADKDAAAEQALKDENCTVIEVDIPSFIAKFDGFAEANYPDLADWVARIKEMDA